MAKKDANGPVIIKKYSNRRLYNTQISNYVTLEDLFEMIKEGVEFVVQDAKTKEDLTRPVLIQIIFEQEAKGYEMLPTQFLRQIISFYDDKLGKVLPHYLDSTMKMFSDNKAKINEFSSKGFEELVPMKMFEEAAKKNMEVFENTFKMFYPNKSTNTEE